MQISFSSVQEFAILRLDSDEMVSNSTSDRATLPSVVLAGEN